MVYGGDGDDDDDMDVRGSSVGCDN